MFKSSTDTLSQTWYLHFACLEYYSVLCHLSYTSGVLQTRLHNPFLILLGKGQGGPQLYTGVGGMALFTGVMIGIAANVVHQLF